MKKNSNLLTLTITNIVLLMVVLSLYCIETFQKRTPSDIYNVAVNNIVEIKAESENVGNSFGTGELIDKDGTLITNAHVVTYKKTGVSFEFERYYIRFVSEEDYRAVSFVKYDTELDIAVLRLADPKRELIPIKIGNSSELKAGEKAYAVGNAANYGVGIFEGIISNPLVNVQVDELTKSVIQSDITIAAGNSGGALLNSKGELIGITTFRTKDLSGNVIYGIVYSIPINEVVEYLSC